MNKTLLLYESKKGMTQKLANILKEKIDYAEIYWGRKYQGDLSQYKSVLLGTLIYRKHK